MAKKKKKTAKKKTKVIMGKAQPAAKEEPESPDEFNDDKYLVQYVLQCKKEADDASKERRAKQKELWLLYQNKQDYTEKKDWQSKAFSPKIFMHTIRAAALIERAALQTSTLFKVVIDEEYYEEKEREEAEEMAGKVEKKMKNHLEKTNFAESLGENSISSFLLGFGVEGRNWDEEDRMCQYDNKDILDIWVAPNYKPFVQKRPKYIIEEEVMDLADLLDIVEKDRKKGEKSVWCIDEVEKLQSSYAQKQEIRMKKAARKGQSDFSPKDRQVELYKYWGDIVSKDGKRILRNQLLIVANQNQLIRHHENPFDDELPPYRFAIPIPYPHRGTSGTSLVEGGVPMQYTLNNLINLYIDNLNFTVNKMYQMNKSGLVDPEHAKNIYPGKVFMTDTNEQVVREILSNPVGQEVVNAIKVVDGELRQATAISEYVEALPSKHKQTLGEIEKKTAESHGFFDVIARRLERNFIGKLLLDTYNLLLQFSDILSGLEGHYVFKVSGVTLLLQQEKLKQYIEMKLGQALQSEILAGLTDIPLLWKKSLTQVGLQDVYVEPQEEEIPPEEKARQDVANLNPQEKLQLLQRVQGVA